MPMPNKLVLPDLLSVCSIKGSTNPHYEAAAAESRAWVKSFNVFHGEKLAFLLNGSSELLVSHTYPYAEYEQFRTACDFVNLLFVVDEVSDDQNGKDARQTGMVFLNVMRNPSWDDGSKLAQMTKEFRTRFTRSAGVNCQRRFLEHCEDYIEAVSKEAEYRERDEVLGMERYETLRRENSAVRLCFMLAMYALDVDLPDEVFEDSAFLIIYFAACDLVCWANDLYSYNMEQSKGHRGNNILTVLMEAKGISLQQAADVVGEHSAKLMKDLNDAKKRLPGWGVRVDADVARYIGALEDWVIGNLEWSFKSPRYFGPTHDEVKKTRVVVLRPSRRS